MNYKTLLTLLAASLALLTTSQIAQAQDTLGTNTLAISGATFGDGTTLNGQFTYSYDASQGDAIYVLLSASLAVGNSANWTGYDYNFNLPGQTNTAIVPGPGAGPHPGPAPAPPAGISSFFLASNDGASILLIYFPDLNPAELYSASETEGANRHSLDDSGANGNPGIISIVPEPSALALATMGAAGVFASRRKITG